MLYICIFLVVIISSCITLYLIAMFKMYSFKSKLHKGTKLYNYEKNNSVVKVISVNDDRVHVINLAGHKSTIELSELMDNYRILY